MLSDYFCVLLVFLHQVLSFDVQQPLLSNNKKEKIAIIGAGAGGSSTSYYLQKFSSNLYDIKIFEKNSYVGGRSTTIGNHEDDSSEFEGVDIELGGSIFVKSNEILYNSIALFNLTIDELELSEVYPEKFNGTYGVWNGSNFIFSGSSNDNKLRFIGKLIWKYKLSPFRIYRLIKSTVFKFISEYYHQSFPFESLDDITSKTGLFEMIGTTGEEYLVDRGIDKNFLNDLIQPATRVNYISNLNDIHGLETIVSLAADDGTLRIKGGNYQIFENFIKSSQADLKLGTEVLTLDYDPIIDLWNVSYLQDDTVLFEVFDQVVIASPFHQSNIDITGTTLLTIPKDIEYRDLHVTYIRTREGKLINHPYFGLDVDVPELILTTKSELNVSIPFYSINIVNYNSDTGEVIYKIFSPDRITIEFLERYLFTELDLNTTEIYYTKEWKPYPHLKPTLKFENDFQIGPKLWYLNSIEEFISTMETSALAGANVAGLISKGKNTTEITVP